MFNNKKDISINIGLSTTIVFILGIICILLVGQPFYLGWGFMVFFQSPIHEIIIYVQPLLIACSNYLTYKNISVDKENQKLRILLDIGGKLALLSIILWIFWTIFTPLWVGISGGLN